MQLEKLQPQLEQQKQKVASILAELSAKKLLAQEQHAVVSSEKMALTIEDKSITVEMTQAKKELNRVLLCCRRLMRLFRILTDKILQS